MARVFPIRMDRGPGPGEPPATWALSSERVTRIELALSAWELPITVPLADFCMRRGGPSLPPLPSVALPQWHANGTTWPLARPADQRLAKGAASSLPQDVASVRQDGNVPTSSTVLVSAVTSGFVTLAIEWLAKPRLEARKERILAAHRARRQLSDALLSIGVAAARLSRARLPRDMPAAQRQALLAEEQRAADSIDRLTADMVERLGEFAGTYAWHGRDLVIKYTGVMRGVVLSDRSRAEKAQVVIDCTGPMATFLFGSGLRPIGRVRALLKVQALLARYGGDETATVDGAGESSDGSKVHLPGRSGD
jgi:hypothetical protein